MGSFLTVAGEREIETKVGGSRFIAWAAPVESEELARAALEERSRRYFDATHNCAAWRLRSGAWRCVDAGEPGGSAGAPILAAIDGRGCVDLIVVVTRYFGGTKLGIGGLARAYGEAAGAVLEHARVRVGREGHRVRIRYPYQRTGNVMRCIERIRPAEVEHGVSGAGAETTLTVAVEDVALLAALLREETSGSIAPEIIGEVVFYQAEAGGSGLARG